MSDAGFATFNNAARATTLQARRQNHGGDVFVSANQTGNAYLDLASTASLILGATSTTTVNSAKIIADHSIGSTGDHRQMLTFHPVAGNSINYEAFRIRDTEIVANETGSAAQDFRVESNSNSHMLFVDAGANTVGINAQLPRTTFHVNVDGATGGTTNDWNNDKWFLISDGSGASDSGFGITHTAASGTWINSLDPYTSWRDIIVNGDNFKYFQGGSREIMSLGYSAAVFNDGSTDVDFRVESNSSTHALFVKGNTDKVGILNSNPQKPLEITSNDFQLRLSTASGTSNYFTQFISAYDSTNPFRIQGYYNGTQVEPFKIMAAGGFGSPVLRLGQDMSYISLMQGTIERAVLSPTEYTHNEHSHDHDFRVESDSNAHMLFVDGGNNRVHFGSSANIENNIVQVTGTKGLVAEIPQGMLGVNDDTAMAQGVGGAIDFTGKYHTNGSYTSFASVEGYKTLSNNGNYDGTLVLKARAHGGDQVDKLRLNSTEAVFNEDGLDTDFRVESDGNANMLFVDAGNNRVAVGSTGVTGSQFTVAASTNATIVLDGDSYSTWVQDAQWNSLLLGGAYYDSGAKFAVTNRGASQINIGHDGNATPSLQGFIFSSAAAGGSAGTTPPFENLASITRAGTVFNEDSHDRDFRVESDSNSSMFVVDAGGNYVDIGGAGAIGGQLNILGGEGIRGRKASNYKTATMMQPTAFGYSVGTYAVTQIGDLNTQGTVSIGYDPSSNTNGSFSGTGIEMLFTPDIHFYQPNASDDGWVKQLRMVNTGGVTINDGGADLDFRVESDTNANMLLVDASGGTVQVGHGNTGYAELDVQGDISIRGPSSFGTLEFRRGSASLVFARMGFDDPSQSNDTFVIDSSGNGNPMGFITNDDPFYFWVSGDTSNTADVRIENAGGMVINENGNDSDFRVESDNNSYGIYLDAANDRLLVGRGDVSTGEDFFAVDAKPGTSGHIVRTGRDDNSTKNHFIFMNPNGTCGSIQTAGSATLYNTSSDARLKENITDADDAGALIDTIQVRQFDWIEDGEHQRYGMVAQELNTVAPEAVSEGETEDDMMGVDYSKLVPMLIKEIQSLRARVAQLESN